MLSCRLVSRRPAGDRPVTASAVGARTYALLTELNPVIARSDGVRIIDVRVRVSPADRAIRSYGACADSARSFAVRDSECAARRPRLRMRSSASGTPNAQLGVRDTPMRGAYRSSGLLFRRTFSHSCPARHSSPIYLVRDGRQPLAVVLTVPCHVEPVFGLCAVPWLNLWAGCSTPVGTSMRRRRAPGRLFRANAGFG